MEYRSTTEITIEILRTIAKAGSKKTNVRFEACLTSRQLSNYLSKLVRNGLIQYEVDTRLYKITDKGLRFLAFNKLIEQSFGQLLSPSKHIEHS
jgi:predicted transcriptional regulator